ncbi:MAG: molybdenum cofactor guanylyltransferase [Candidatus Acidiferrales bacterium]
MKRHRQVAGFILAGGTSSRMGRDKGLLEFDDVPLLLHTARLLESLVAEVTVVGSARRYAALGVRVIADEAAAGKRARAGASRNGCGPLAGIAAALSATRFRWNLIVACDMPYLSVEWLDWLLSRAVRSSGQAVVPRSVYGLEPLAAVYRRECATPIATTLARGVRKVTDALDDLRLDLVYPRDWRHLDSAGLVLKNMNAPRDYEEALNWWRTSDRHTARASTVPHVTSARQAPQRTRRSVPRRRK